jgi:hypothetical protein
VECGGESNFVIHYVKPATAQTVSIPLQITPTWPEFTELSEGDLLDLSVNVEGAKSDTKYTMFLKTGAVGDTFNDITPDLLDYNIDPANYRFIPSLAYHGNTYKLIVESADGTQIDEASNTQTLRSRHNNKTNLVTAFGGIDELWGDVADEDYITKADLTTFWNGFGKVSGIEELVASGLASVAPIDSYNNSSTYAEAFMKTLLEIVTSSRNEGD